MTQRGHIRREGSSWRLYWRRAPEPGQPRRQVSARLGDVRELPTVAAARRAADRLLAGTDNRMVNAATVMSWPAWCEVYEARYLVLLSRGSRATRASIIRRHLVDAPSLAGLPLHRIDDHVAQEFVLAQHAAGAAASTTRARFALLRVMLRAAAADGLSATPPRADHMRFPRDESAPIAIRAKAFTPAECARILEAAPDPLLTAICLARYIGLRASEVCGVSWTAINLVNGQVEVRQQALGGELRPLKSKSSRATLRAPVPLLARLRAYRETWTPNPAGLLFADEGGSPADPATFRRELHRLLDQLGIARRGLHGFRHSCAIAMATAGVNPEAMRRSLRHASIRTTAIYLDADAADVSTALEGGANVDGEMMGTDYAKPGHSPQSAITAMTPEGTSEGPAP